MITWFDEKLWIKSLVQKNLGIPTEKILFTEHHLSHAASAFFCSPFDEAAVLTVDGVGEWTTTTIGTAQGALDGSGENRITLSREIRFPHSLGLLYSAFTAFLGFEVNEGEYKVMGMAPYGEPRYQDRVYRLLRLSEDAGFELNLDSFSFHYSPEEWRRGGPQESADWHESGIEAGVQLTRPIASQHTGEPLRALRLDFAPGRWCFGLPGSIP